jgi:hypothetical protein
LKTHGRLARRQRENAITVAALQRSFRAPATARLWANIIASSYALTRRIRMNFDFATAIETKIIGLDPVSALNLFANHSGMAHFPLEGRTVVDPLLTPNLGCVNPRCRGSGCQQ